jgi:hypothetical protein
MIHQYNVFSGVFMDENAQRFLRILHECIDNAFTELYNHSMPQHPSQFRTCLDRVTLWDGSVIHDEYLNISKKFADIVDIFKQVYVNFVKAMRGSKVVKLMVNMPKFEDFLRSFFNQVSRHKCMRSGKYYNQSSLLDQRVTCLDAVRDTMFEFLGDDHVKLEERSVISESGLKETHSTKLDQVASKANCRNTRRSSEVSSVASYKGAAKESQISTQESKVVSDVCSHLPNDEHQEYDNDSVAPDDSVSNVDFADKQHRAIQRFMDEQPRIAEDDEKSEQSSKTSMSLSSVEISQSGVITKKPAAVGDFRRGYKDMTDPGFRRPRNDNMSEASMHSENNRVVSKKRSPVRSYVTSLTEDDV